jgi:GntR family transcriptional regulator of vanillate catabolism
VAEPALKADERSGSQTLRAQLALRDLVLSGQIKPGERLSELAIVERIGVSRTPVRAALMMLAEEGLVESVPSGGFAVRAFSDGEVLEAIEDYVDLNARFHREIVALAESRLVERQLERVMTLPFASPSAFVMAQSQMPEALQILLIAQDQHHCIVEAIASREGARAEAVTREHSRLAGRNLALALRSKRTFDLVPGSALIRLRGS